MGRKLVSHSQKYPQPEKGTSIWFKQKLEARTLGQEFYLDTINESDITLCLGPAGCGKTWIVARLALEALAANRVEKIIVTKPIIEAGEEQLGFVKGEISEKVAPYFASILDCFEDHIGPTMVKKLLDTEKIVFLPMAYCRGRDLKHAFIFIDEAQNLTRKGMKLMLTRISEGSKMVINGDTDQIDLPNESKSGLRWAADALSGKSNRIGVVEMTAADIQRHPLVSVIVQHLR